MLFLLYFPLGLINSSKKLKEFESVENLQIQINNKVIYNSYQLYEKLEPNDDVEPMKEDKNLKFKSHKKVVLKY